MADKNPLFVKIHPVKTYRVCRMLVYLSEDSALSYLSEQRFFLQLSSPSDEGISSSFSPQKFLEKLCEVGPGHDSSALHFEKQELSSVSKYELASEASCTIFTVLKERSEAFFLQNLKFSGATALPITTPSAILSCSEWRCDVTGRIELKNNVASSTTGLSQTLNSFILSMIVLKIYICYNYLVIYIQKYFYIGQIFLNDEKFLKIWLASSTVQQPATTQVNWSELEKLGKKLPGPSKVILNQTTCFLILGEFFLFNFELKKSTWKDFSESLFTTE